MTAAAVTPKPLRLKAIDAEDLQVISAVLQDAIVPVMDMLWQKPEGEFIMVAQRLIPATADEPAQRICCALTLRGVMQMQIQKLDLADGERMLDLLAVMQEGNALLLIFAGGACIRAQVQDWSLTIADFGEAWPAGCCPKHEDHAVGANK